MITYTCAGSVRTFCAPNAVSKFVTTVNGTNIRMIISPSYGNTSTTEAMYKSLHLSAQWINDKKNDDLFSMIWDGLSDHLRFDPRGFYETQTSWEDLDNDAKAYFTRVAKLIRVRYPSITPLENITIEDHNPFFPIKGKLGTSIWYVADGMETWEPCPLHVTTGLKDSDLRAVGKSWLRKNATYRIGVLIEGHVKGNMRRLEELETQITTSDKSGILTPEGALALRKAMLLF